MILGDHENTTRPRRMRVSHAACHGHPWPARASSEGPEELSRPPPNRRCPSASRLKAPNILTRNLMILRARRDPLAPAHAGRVAGAVRRRTRRRGCGEFDGSFWSQWATRSRTAAVPSCGAGQADCSLRRPSTARWRRTGGNSRATRQPSSLLADLSLLTLGGSLKRKEMISARLGGHPGGDLSAVCRAEAVRGRGAPRGRPAHRRLSDDHRQRAHCACLRGRAAEPARHAGRQSFVRVVAFPVGFARREPADRLVSRLAEILMVPGAQRDPG